MSQSQPPTPPTAEPAATTTGSESRPVVLGVCSAFADRTGCSVPVARAAVVTLSAAGGLGVVVYLAAALLWRNRTSVAPKTPKIDSSADIGVGLLCAGVVWISAGLWPGVRLALVVPVGLVSAGIALGWKSTPTRERDAPRTAFDRFGTAIARTVSGLVLCIAGLGVVFSQSTDLATFRDTAVALAVALTGIGLVLGPSVVSAIRSITSERDERVRAEERARVASHLHDSVLQTLTLIQKRAADPAQAASLARHQERSLRRWLYGGALSYDIDGIETLDGSSWRSAFEAMVEDVESRHDTAVELVMVGAPAHPGFEAISPLVGATREAIVNSAKFSGERAVSVYCELSGSTIHVFVRDRGVGFDPAAVPTDRRGIRDSIVGRMHSAGGSAQIRSAPDEGTEIVLSAPVLPDGASTAGSLRGRQ